MTKMKMSKLITEERLERALAFAAYLVMKHGPEYTPFFDRAEKELVEFRRNINQSVEDRARQLLSCHTREGWVKAIRG